MIAIALKDKREKDRILAGLLKSKLGRQYSSWEFIPFGGGSRRCLGYALALLAAILILKLIGY